MVTSSRLPRPNPNTPWWPTNYRQGTWAWVLHRVTGLALVAYLFLHIWVISFAAARDGKLSFQGVMDIFHTPLFLALDVGLLAAVLYHSLNGIRILLFDLGIGVRVQKQLWWSVLLVAAVGVATGAYLIFPYILGRPQL